MSKDGPDQQAERYKAWRPDSIHPTRLDMYALVDGPDHFAIFMKTYDQNREVLKIKFRRRRAYRTIDEGARLIQLGSFKADRDSVIYIVENSSFLEEFHRQSLDISKGDNLVHYFITSDNDCVDVISNVEPEVSWVEKSRMFSDQLD
jgi:hypothetical protein